MRTRLPALALTLALVAAAAQAAPAGPDPDRAAVERLLAEAKYASAAQYLAHRPALLAQPAFIRLYTHILVTDYVETVDFQLFVLRDLKPGERVEDYRGRPGAGTLVGGSLGQLLYRSIKNYPDSADVNYAVGEYLSRASACGCAQGLHFKDLPTDDGVYFLKAWRGKVYDAWSLFRIGLHYQQAQPPQLDRAIAFYERSLALDPGRTDTVYDLATAYYQKGDLKHARHYAGLALGKYADPGLAADTYQLYGRICLESGDYRDAEQGLTRALALQPWHKRAFMDLLSLYRRTHQERQYIRAAEDYIAIDYANSYLFNNYVEFLADNGLTPADQAVEKHLLSLHLIDPRQAGAVYFNLGRLAEFAGDPREALRRYRVALAAFKAIRDPPPGAIEALKQRIAELGEPPAAR